MILTRLTLTEFRNYPALTWHPQARLQVITGPNGTGKTNLLEAISLLVPGRGLRNARLADLPRLPATGQPWGVAAQFADGLAIGTGSAPDAVQTGAPARRAFRLDGEPPRSQAAIAARLAAVWLTPQMDRLFGEGASGRRRFLDRLVWALEPGHAREVAAHDTAMTSRNRLLSQPGADPAWLAGLEDSMARHAVAAAAARLTLVAQLNTTLANGAAGRFPTARMALLDPVATRLQSGPALAAEDWLRAALHDARAADAAAGSASLGAHRADMALADAATGLPAALASTGQQKALLLGVILGHAALITAARGTPPVLLLDEPAVHLDATRRQDLLDALAATTGTIVLSGTDPDIFAPLHGLAEGWSTGNDSLHRDPTFPPPRGR